MPTEKEESVKTTLHPRNKNRERYDLRALLRANPELAAFIIANKNGDDTVDFSKPKAVKILNQALLNHYYGIKKWEFPDTNLWPPIPGRADYIHYLADLLTETNLGVLPTGDKITCLDIGVGASCIYPIIGVAEYNWNMIGSDIDPKSIESAMSIVSQNASLKNKIDCRLQANRSHVFTGIIGDQEKIDLTICNPPFHSSAQEAAKGTLRKIKNLSGKKPKSLTLNFAGVSNELYCDGGEYGFILNLISDSRKFAKNCFWFSTLVSKQDNLKGIYKALEATEASEVKTIPMETGNKFSRIVTWTFLTKAEQKEWRETRW